MPATYDWSLIAGLLVSDHRLITLETSNTKPKQEKRTVWKVTDETITQFKNKFNSLPILDSTALNMAANQLNNEILKTIKKIAPATTKSITSRHKKPWYDEDLKNKRKILKNNERKWIRYREGQHWKAYKREWNRFVTMLRYKEHNLIHNLINTKTTDNKKLYRIITEVTSQNKQNPLPKSTSDQQLAEDFAAFFLNKMQNIKKLFKSTHAFTPKPNDTHIWKDSQHLLIKKSTKLY